MIYFNLGRRRVGKTTLARYMAVAKRPQLVIDPRAQWEPAPGAVIFSDCVSAKDTEEILDTLDAGQDAIVQPEHLEESVGRLAVVSRTYLMDEEFPGRTLSIIGDECGLYHLREWSWMMRCSPYDRVSIILTAHRPRDIDPTVRALGDVWNIFRTTQEHDLDVIESRCGDAVRAQVGTLGNYEFVSWNDAIGEMTIHKNPAAWKSPSSAPLVGDIPKPATRKLWD